MNIHNQYINQHEWRGYRRKRPYATIVLVAVNVLVFFFLTAQGMTEDSEFMLRHGAMYVPYVVEAGEYYRLLTCMFLHFGFEHLMNNMVVMVLIGSNLELEIGKIKFVILYFASGLVGNILSALWDIRVGAYVVSAGASGAVFGLIGALLCVVIRNRGQLGTFTGRGILFMIVVMLYFGFTSSGVDNAAHIAGLVSGFILAIILYRKRKSKLSSFSWNG